MAYCFNVDECNSDNNAMLVRLFGWSAMGTYLCGNPRCEAKARAINACASE